MMNILFELLLNAFQSVMMIAFMKKVTRPLRGRGYGTDLIFILLIFGALTAYSFFTLPVSDTFILILPFLYTVVTERGTWLRRAFWTAILGVVMNYVAVIMIDLYGALFGIGYEALMEPGVVRAGFTVTSNIAMALILFTVSRIAVRRTAAVIPPAMSVFPILLLLCQYVSAELFYLSKLSPSARDALSVASLVCAFIGSAITYILYEAINQTAEKRHRQELMEQTMALSRKYQADIGAVYDRMLIAQHDLRHQIAMAQDLLTQAGITETPAELQAAIRASSVITTGCISADAVLTAKKAAAIKNGIDFDLELFPLNPLPINETDFCILLTNILDNAIEGAANSSPADNNKYVHLHFRRAWNMFNIICKNSADPASVRIENNRCIPLNKISGLHGLGTESIRQTVTTHSGKCDFSLRDDTFMVYIVIPDDEE